MFKPPQVSRALVVGFLVWCGVACAANFEAGADVSHLRFFEDRGAVYRESEEPRDALVILRNQGLTCARLRLFTSSAAQAQADPYNRINNLDYTIPLAQRVKKAGLRLLLDFHYSDTWADPGKQAKPSAWANLAFAELEQRMYEYNRDCIRAFAEAGAIPDQVQVGNEITSGLLWPEGRVGGSFENPTQWQQLGTLLKAAIRGIKEASGTNQPVILIHIDRGGDWNATRWYFDGLRAQQVEFDAIGLSYYPFWHGTFEALRTCLEGAVGRYGKPVAIVETDFPWSNSNDILGLPATPDGQSRYLVELAKIVKGLPQNRGLGIYWWGAEYRSAKGVNTAGFEYRSLFDNEGNVLPVASTLGRLAAPAVLKTAKTGTNVTLSWPLSGAGWSLMASTNLAFPVSWASLGSDFADDGYGFTTNLPLQEEASRFYRLQSN
jgi:arabinogalactan endo-1,4-beta-galactosidase